MQYQSIVEEKISQSMLDEAPGTQEGQKLPQYLVTLSVGIVVISGGTTIGWTSLVMAYLTSPDSPFTLTKDQASWTGSLLPIGAFFGAILAGPIANIIGQKLAILSTGLPLALSWLLIFTARSVTWLFIARFVAGIGLGAACALVPTYISEIAEKSVRGVFGTAFQLSLVFGIVYAYVTGAVLCYNNLSIACGILPLLFFLAFSQAPESPMYLLRRNKKIQAEKSLRTLRGNKYNVSKELSDIEKEIVNQEKTKVSFFQAVFNRTSVRALTICLGLMVFQQISGINIVTFYSASIFKDAGSSLKPEYATIIVGVAQLVATIPSSLLVDKAGRKMLLQLSSLVMAISLWALGFYFLMKDRGNDVSSYSWIPLMSVVVYIIFFSVGFGPIPWIMTAEIFPQEIKAVGCGLAVVVNWTMVFAVTKLFQPLLFYIGTAYTFWLFGSATFVGLAFVFFLVIETKGKSLGQIQTELCGK
ncbi:facilitated trehalose transporter Tret1-like isoform X2 [Cimex lectularius]|uniref:Major facilitator superfamily (MFS) profile domain-containing protein n=1 Tax=Cimex lectularius TaxID=79782 RepID=A0A8I6SE79_CIMLE|nr:facilitated trehalose transporter Tret1-like isoform X2 [Cimex lectularius]